MEERQEGSATERGTGNPSLWLPASPPDVANLENISLSVDQVTSAKVLESLMQYPQTVIGAKSNADFALHQEPEVPKMTDKELQSGSEKYKTGSNIFTNENQGQGIFIQDTPPNLAELSLSPKVSAKVLQSTSQDLENPGKMDNHENVTCSSKPKKNNKLNCRKLENPELTINDFRPNSAKHKKACDVSANGNQTQGIFLQDTPSNLAELGLAKIISAKVLESSSQDLETPGKVDNHKNVTSRWKPKKNNELDSRKSEIPELTINEAHSNSAKHKKGCNVSVEVNQAQEIFIQDVPSDSADQSLAQKTTVEVLESSPQDLKTLEKIDDHANFTGCWDPKKKIETDCKNSKVPKSPINEVRPNLGKNQKQRTVSADGNEAQEIFMQDALSFAGDTSELHPTAEITVRVLDSSSQDLETFQRLDHHEKIANCEKPKNQSRVRCDANRDNSEDVSNEIVTLDENTDRVFESAKQKSHPKIAEGSKHDENAGFTGKVTTLSATDLKSRLDMEFFDPENADHVEVIFSRNTPSKLAGGSTRSLGETSSRRCDGNLWRVVSGRLFRGFRKCNWFPKMCSCLEGGSPMSGQCSTGRTGSYERLGSGPTLFEFSSMVQRARRRAGNKADESVDNERQAELRFYHDDLTWTRVCVEKNLRTMDLCEILKVKRNATGNEWSIVETWPELGIERTLEDHEDILATHREMEMFASHHERKFYFRKDFLKYEFFISPKQFFPEEMVSFPNDEDRGSYENVEEALRSYLARNDAECPQVFSLVWIRDESSSTWKKTYMLLQGRKLYTTKKPTRSVRSHMESYNAGTLPKRTLDHDQPSPLAHLSDYYVYKIPNAKRYFNAPFEWGACLRPSSNAEAEDTEAGVPGLKVIAFTSEKSRACWLTAMRLAKYGKQLRENYRAFRNKQCEQNGGGSTKEQYSSYNVPNESLRSRVAMDFTGSVGRIVEDPKEAKDIAESEGIIWRRRWRPFSRPPPGCGVVRLHGLDGGIHVLQPWFHSGLNRDIAAAIIKEHGSVDGVFLVRESKSNPGAYVLTYKYSEKIFHAQIQPIFDERRNCWLYTLDKGVTKFYDLLQLIEFYQLNSGSLPTRLTHYVQNGVTIAQQRQEDGGASPSPPFSANQNMSPKSDCPKSSSGI